MKPIIYFTSLLILFSLSSCKKNPEHLDLEQNLIGIWKYTGSGGGFTGKYEPADPAVEIILELKKDHTYISTRNDEVIQSGKFDITRVRSIYSAHDEDAIRFDVDKSSEVAPYIIILNGNQLSLGHNVYDGISSGYTRIGA
jgi:hypothetical protein